MRPATNKDTKKAMHGYSNEIEAMLCQLGLVKVEYSEYTVIKGEEVPWMW